MQNTQLLVSGVLQGSLYALVAVGMMVVLRTTGVINFGHPALILVGAYTVHVVSRGIGAPYAVAVVVAGLIGVAAGSAFHGATVVAGERSAILPRVLATLALSSVIGGVVTAIWGRNPVAVPSALANRRIQLGEVVINGQMILTLGVAAVVMAALALFFARSVWGLALTAAEQSAAGAGYVGIPINRADAFAWAIGGSTAAIAGALFAPLDVVTPDFGADLLVKAFAAVVLAGLSSTWGALAGSLVLGVTESFTAYHASDYVVATSFVVVAVVVLIAPGGILSRQAFARVAR